MTEENLKKGELNCEFIYSNLDEVTDFWRKKKLGTLEKDEPIPTFSFVTPQNVENGYYWFIVDGWLFTHCEVRVIGYSENTHCESDIYICEKYESI